jgi:ATP-dependent Clp protease protease subunit
MIEGSAQDCYGVFCGGIDASGVKRIFEAVGAAMAAEAPRLHLLLQSSGGTLGDGVCLYDYLRAVPIEVVAYNVGSICSAAIFAYLGARQRKTSAFAAFMIHRTYISPHAARAENLQAFAHAMILDDERSEAILRQCIHLSDEMWAVHKTSDLWISAQIAVESGLATEFGEFAPPPGSAVVTI